MANYIDKFAKYAILQLVVGILRILSTEVRPPNWRPNLGNPHEYQRSFRTN